MNEDGKIFRKYILINLKSDDYFLIFQLQSLCHSDFISYSSSFCKEITGNSSDNDGVFYPFLKVVIHSL